ncbi:hypothetical protein FOA52_015539 [Chlamydomonas sp. UWO 241]|nr:hypothetical protein FOA52_015539 [Chlamydomonas sp. UWO 241]
MHALSRRCGDTVARQASARLNWSLRPASSQSRRCASVAASGAASTSACDEPCNGYRPNVGVCIFNKAGYVFAAQRCDDDTPGSWQMPQGGIDEGEEPHEAALREVTEETSIVSARIVGEIDGWLTYDFPTRVKESLTGGWQKFKGQKQRWYLAHFYGDDSEINLGTAHKEFRAWKWSKLEDLPGSVVEFKRDVYVEVAKGFVPMIKQLVESGELTGNEERSH